MSRATQDTAENHNIACTGLSPTTVALSNALPVLLLLLLSQSYNPVNALLHLRFGLLRFRSPLLAQSLLFSSPMGNEMFQFPTFASYYQG